MLRVSLNNRQKFLSEPNVSFSLTNATSTNFDNYGQDLAFSNDGSLFFVGCDSAQIGANANNGLVEEFYTGGACVDANGNKNKTIYCPRTGASGGAISNTSYDYNGRSLCVDELGEKMAYVMTERVSPPARDFIRFITRQIDFLGTGEFLAWTQVAALDCGTTGVSSLNMNNAGNLIAVGEMFWPSGGFYDVGRVRIAYYNSLTSTLSFTGTISPNIPLKNSIKYGMNTCFSGDGNYLYIAGASNTQSKSFIDIWQKGNTSGSSWTYKTTVALPSSYSSIPLATNYNGDTFATAYGSNIYIYSFNGTTATQTNILSAPDIFVSNVSKVTMPRGNGAPQMIVASDPNYNSIRGCIYVANKIKDSWQVGQIIQPAGIQAGDGFGGKISISNDGNVLAAGASIADRNGITNKGYATLFFRR